MRGYYQRTKPQYQAYARRKYRERKELVDQIRLERGCARCGYREHACALDFHHRDPEAKELKLAGSKLLIGLDRLMREIAKCDVLCANCHRVLHHAAE